MDLFLVSLLLLTLPLTFRETQADKDPISKYSEYLNNKDVKEDMKRRRKHTRVQPISLKPAPKDWPEPQMAAGDFIVTDQSEATSLSPLLTYQAKLEKEYIRQRKEKMLQEQNKEKLDNIKTSSTFTSSEEDLHKLLDPDELLKHNKQLRPFVNQGKHSTSSGDQLLADEKQGKEAKPAGISTLTALKAKTAARKTRKKIKSAPFMITTTSKSRRGRKRKTSQKKEWDDKFSSEESKRKRSDHAEPSKTKSPRKRVRGFTFANKEYEKYDKITAKGRKLKNKTPNIEEASRETLTTSSPTDTQLSTEKVLQKITNVTSATTRSEVMDHVETSKPPSNKTIISKKETDVGCSSTTSKISTPSNSIEDSLSFINTPDLVVGTPEVTGSLGTMEIKHLNSSINITQNCTHTSTTRPTDVNDHAKTTKPPSNKTMTSKKETEVKYSSTTSTISLLSKSPDSSSFTKTSDLASTLPEMTTSYATTEITNSGTRTNEIRKKRKEIKQEMEKVLDDEELEGSFADSDTDWTTSEKEKVPIHLVTPRHALMGILKHKVVSVIDKILNEGKKLKKDQIPK